jgi:hypothetical protein
MTRVSTALLGFCSALALGTFGAKATTYNFIETSCASMNGGCPGGPNGFDVPSLPAVIATFSSPDATGQYQFDSIGSDPPFESGDTDFSLQWAGTGDAPVSAGGCPDVEQRGCEWNITWGAGQTKSSSTSPSIPLTSTSSAKVVSGLTQKWRAAVFSHNARSRAAGFMFPRPVRSRCSGLRWDFLR